VARGVIKIEGDFSIKENMAWLRSNWRWSALNLFAISVLVHVLSHGSTGWSNTDTFTFDSGLVSGKWAIRFLLACLTMTPLNTYFGWKGAIKFRKSAGLWAFGFASAHILLYVREANLKWLTLPMPFYLVLGLVGMTILSALAVTSNRWTMQHLGKNWKRLHRLVYFSGISVVTHSLLATMMSKKILIRDPEAPNELKVYVLILSALLVVRIPLVRKLLKQIPVLLKRKPNLQVSPIAKPDGGAELWPKFHGRESGVSIKPSFIISNVKPTECNSMGSPPGKTNGFSGSYADDPSIKIPLEEKAEVQ
jgi:methionine sulfoxide reductase heme-binding subunit